MLEMKYLGTIRIIVCITATFTQQIVGQIVLGQVVFVICTVSMLKILWTGLAKVRFLVRTYLYLSYHIEIKPNDPRWKRLGSVHHQNLTRPKSPGRNDPNSVICAATMLKLFGLVYCPILRLKNVFFFARKFTENRKQSTLH